MTGKGFLRKKGVELSVKIYLVDAMSAMALGLFASLLIGTIFATLGEKIGVSALADHRLGAAAAVFLTETADFAKSVTGAALGLAVAHALKAPPLVLFSAAAVGHAGYALGGPVGSFVAAIVAAECGKIVSKETKVDIIVTPAVTLLTGAAVAQFAGPGVSAVMTGLGALIMTAAELEPLWVGVIVSVLVGMALTLPISSAALCLMFSLGGVAAGAATAGCCAQMIGFAVMSFRENRWGGLIAQGLGTSMLQMGNIIKNPLIWIPPTVVSAVTGPVATVIFQLENIPAGAGMGTCGLVGPFGVMAATPNSPRMWLGLVLVCFVLPAVLTPLVAAPLRRLGWIRDGDLKLPG
ncbi:MAG: PTS sugar transporter subunit IIC [Gracilibacteraceae bacterium]|jgi:uncharacterized membrane protein|nr:PTS sugar transporter subunit IIC [Gracilibacteraceae bacterium]